jgi:hypothetical protein
MKFILIALLIFGYGNLFAQSVLKKDSTIKFVYKDPSFYIEKAGGLGQFKSGLVIFGFAASAFIVMQSPDIKPATAASIPGAFFVMGYLVDIAIYNNLKRAGLAMKERGLYLGSASNGVGVTYRF